MHSKTVFTYARPDGFLHRGSTICKTSYEDNAVASTILVETSIRRSRNADSKITTSSRSPQLVDTGSKHAQGQIFSTKKYKQNHKHQCFVARLGQKSRASDCPRSLASRVTVWHINCQELEAVLLTIKRFLPQLTNQLVLIRSDNYGTREGTC